MYFKINSVKNRNKNVALFIFCFVLFATLHSCFVITGVKNKPSKLALDTHEQKGFVKATIINYTLDGCSFMVQLEDGKKLEPVNLQMEFRKDNFKVWIKYQYYKSNSICMAGEMATITAIEKR